MIERAAGRRRVALADVRWPPRPLIVWEGNICQLLLVLVLVLSHVCGS